MKKIIVANWKMCGLPEIAENWGKEVTSRLPEIASDQVEVIVCPPAPLLPYLKDILAGSRVHLGAQDCHSQQEGAYTGDVSAALLKAVGCSHVIVGHSERRSLHGETDVMVSAKAARAIKTGLVPIICIGETQKQRENGETLDVINRQVKESIPDEAKSGNFVLAYEPVWAIGSGNLPTMDEISQVHDAVISSVSKRAGVDISEVMVLYGGSVKPDNAAGIMQVKGVAGVLVGGASLKADDFCKIVASANASD
jgi:triosephosphate isomerase